jgi:hypothetical protein
VCTLWLPQSERLCPAIYMSKSCTQGDGIKKWGPQGTLLGHEEDVLTDGIGALTKDALQVHLTPSSM